MDNVSAGSCLLNWNYVCKPKDYGGLGILNLEKIAPAFRLRCAGSGLVGKMIRNLGQTWKPHATTLIEPFFEQGLSFPLEMGRK